MKTVSILGATGSIGSSTLNVIRQHPDKFRVKVLVSGSNQDKLDALEQEFSPEITICAKTDGEQAVLDAASADVDICIAGITGSAGMLPTLTATKHADILAVANKETVVCAGHLLKQTARRHLCTLLPIDSEHNAIFQVFDAVQRGSIDHITLTASGGAFRDWTLEDLKTATAKDAVKHPVWSMGAKISVDSATMMNKGLEVIEACHLFDLPEDRVHTILHPQSIIHGMVQYQDGSLLAQLGTPDMGTPISYALGWPDRLPIQTKAPDLHTLTFKPICDARYPCLALARQAYRNGHGACVILNAANEEAVAAFLQNQLAFTQIAELVEETLAALPAPAIDSIQDIQALEGEARKTAQDLMRAPQKTYGIFC